MDFNRRQQQIIDRLRPKPVHHGQLETILIAVPTLKSEEISPERWQVLRDSLVQEGSNLIPLIVRRTEAYADEEYEVIYGADWCLVARELNIQRLWVWVFDLDDEQAAVTRLEMELLLGNSIPSTSPPDEIQQVSTLIQRSEQSLERKISQQLNSLLQHLEQAFEKRISQQMNVLFERLEQSFEQKISQHSETMNRAIVELKQTPTKQATSSRRKTAASSGSPYSKVTVPQLKKLAEDRQLEGFSKKLRKAELIDLLTKADQQASS